MRINIEKLDLLLARRCMALTDLRKETSSQTITRIRHGAEVKPRTVGRIAVVLNCDPEDILEV